MNIGSTQNDTEIVELGQESYRRDVVMQMNLESSRSCIIVIIRIIGYPSLAMTAESQVYDRTETSISRRADRPYRLTLTSFA